MGDKKTMVAFDCGNSSFRLVVGQYEDGKVVCTVIRQIPNRIVKIGAYYYWDLLYIFQELKTALKEAAVRYPKIDSIGVCTWGVDFALFDKDGHMLANPLAYRNEIGERELEGLGEKEREQLFFETGILCDKINSVYMLAGMKKLFPQIMEAAERCLMVPDIINYFLTGEMVNELSELSTTQLLSAGTRQIDKTVCEKFGIHPGLFGRIGRHGEKIGSLRKDICEEIGVGYEIPVICVPSHDTASAVAAIPAAEKQFGFISCGTWSLIGTELDEPVISEAVMRAGLTNEVGAFGKITLLKNSAGMFVVNQLKKEYDFFNGRTSSWDEISKMAEECKESPVIDLNDSAFFNPANMSEAVWKALIDSGQTTGGLRWDVLFRTFYESLARCYAETIAGIEKATGNVFEKIYIAGGGSASRVLLRLTAKYVGKPIVVCYGESTSMGNFCVQLHYFMNHMDLAAIRRMVAGSFETEEVIVKDGCH